ncbi:hypothetical protein AWM79_15580 [Pseudomonas agarici]|uniref:Uncharacterized protein n=1 Tax=Pseudomonas agarici TaxID=46677 RepID=A0A0X1T455_PSEAA|nr:hypothetical protein [Pseudomonas agarici]AMB86649.1 hypothetical protein AWM79_15580 [Pseudomonas agarici]
MRNLLEPLSQYAAYRRDWRTITSHFVDTAQVVGAVAVLPSGPGWPVAGPRLIPLAFLAAALAGSICVPK